MNKITWKPLAPYFICTLASLFYVYDFVIRILPGTMSLDLMRQYQVTAEGLGLLSSFFFLGYMLMQVPCGLLYDRFGPRRLLTLTCLLASVSTFFFIATQYFFIATMARFFMGIGSAFAYIGALVLASRWLPHRYYAVTAGLIQLMGSIGAIIGEEPIARLMEHQSTFYVTTMVAIIGLLLTALFWLLIKDYPPGMKEEYQPDEFISMITQLKNVAKNSQSWSSALYGFAIWAPISVFASLWAIPFLATLYHLTNTQAASLASFLWVGVGLGGPVFGWLSNALQSRRIPLMIGASIGILSSLLILYIPTIPQSLMLLLLFLFGCAGSAQAVTFGVVQDNNPSHRAGTAAGFNNMAIVIGGTTLQPLTGLLLQWQWKGFAIQGIPIYSIMTYRIALAVLPICFFISLLTAFFLIRETHCQLVNDT